MTDSESAKDGFWLRIIYIVSFLISAVVAFLILGPRPEGMEGSVDVSMLPLVNAVLNAVSGCLLVLAFVFIKQRKINAHKTTMLAAFATSALFLVTYVVYHWFKAGPRAYEGDYAGFYYVVLISHILLAAIIIPLALITLYRGWNMQLEKHRYIAKITLPLWLYVSVTGVLIYAMLY